MELSVNQTEYSNTPNGPIIHIFGRELNGTLHEIRITGFRPYFWVKESDISQEHAEYWETFTKKILSL